MIFAVNMTPEQPETEYGTKKHRVFCRNKEQQAHDTHAKQYNPYNVYFTLPLFFHRQLGIVYRQHNKSKKSDKKKILPACMLRYQPSEERPEPKRQRCGE